MPFNSSKYCLSLLIAVTSVPGAMAQLQVNKPDASSTIPTVSSVYTPSSYSGTMPVNHVRTWKANGPFTDPVALTGAGFQHAQQSTHYFDGLVRPLQTIVRQATLGTSPKDLITPIEYDQAGRQMYKFMSYVGNTTDGLFHANPFAEQKAYLETVYANPAEKVFYSKTDYETSPLGRELKTMAPGNSRAGSGVGSQQKYLINNVADEVVIWNIVTNPLTYTNNDVTTNIPTANSTIYYSPGELYKSILIDEQGNATVEYKDKEGKLILKKLQISSIATDYSGYDGFLSTYYIYDEKDNLRFVLPPKAIEAIRSGWVIVDKPQVINELCFRYEYDERGRVLAHKAPGAGWVYMVYDMLDRLIFNQDANLRANNQWYTTLYDALNRQVITGITTWVGSPVTLQSIVNANTTTPVVPPGLEVDKVFDAPTAGDHQASNSILMVPGFTAGYSSSNFSASIISENAGSMSIEGVVVHKYPVPSDGVFTPLIISYFDNYSWTNKTYTAAYNSQLNDIGKDISKHINLYPEDLPAQASTKIVGMETGTKERILKTPGNLSAGEWLTTVNFYDDKGRLVQLQSDHHKQQADITINRYDFSDRIVGSYVVHTNPGAAIGTTSIKTVYKYDPAGRLLETWKTINDNEQKKTLIASNEYDESGMLKKKELGKQRDPSSGNYTNQPLETLDYSYNIMGALKGINKEYVNDQPAGNGRWFGMELSYDWGFQTNQLNGSVSGVKWRSKGDGERRSYGYSYDATNRLMGADFGQYNGTNYIDHATINFDVQMGNGTNASSAYDENGNIKAMKQWGLLGNNSNLIDDLQYIYHGHSNKLQRVTDLGTAANNFKLGDFKDKSTGTDDYGYDKNGNLITDLNKRINGATGIDQTMSGDIIYNHLNLPWQVKIKNDNGTERGTITYTYDAVGAKLQKITEEKTATGSITTTTDYISDFVYESKVTTGGSLPPLPEDNYQAKLQFINHEDGRIRYTPAEGANPADFIYDYFIKDNLGNVRMVLTDEVKKTLYLASMETAARTQEEQVFYNIGQTFIAKSAVTDGYPVDNSPVTDPNDFVARVNGSNNKIGPALVLKVMSGDKVDIGVSHFYRNNGSYNDGVDLIPNILSSLAGGIVGISGETKGALSQLNTNPGPLVGAINDFRGDKQTSQSGNNKPKAYLNWILLDEQFKYVAASSGALVVSDPNIVKPIASLDIPMTKNGYLYVYVSNETQNWDVYFDNLSIKHYAGPMVEETHYYPFGLTMAGISSKAMGKLENRYKANAGNELNSDLDFNIYETIARSYDPQLGRFHQMDPLADDYMDVSPYSFAFNDPVSWVDPLGAENVNFTWEDLLKQIENGTITSGHYYNLGGNTFNFSQIETVRYDEKNQLLRVYFPQEVYVDEEGHEVAVTTKRAVTHYVSNQYRHMKESWVDNVPIAGDLRAAGDDIRKGRWGWAIFHTLMAASDILLVKAIFTAPAKIAIKQMFKGGVKGARGGLKNYFGVGMSHNYGAAVQRWKKLGVNQSGYKHHWLISQKTMERYPFLKKIGNQQWNLKSFRTQASHMRWAHGQVYQQVGYSYWKWVYPFTSTPMWTKYLTFSIGGRVYE